MKNLVMFIALSGSAIATAQTTQVRSGIAEFESALASCKQSSQNKENLDSCMSAKGFKRLEHSKVYGKPENGRQKNQSHPEKVAIKV